MKEKRLWAASLIVLGLAAICLGLVQLFWAGVPDGVVRMLGVVVLIALPVSAFAAARLVSKKR